MTTNLRPRSVSTRAAVALMAILLVMGVGAGFALEQSRDPQWEAGTDVLIKTWSIDSLVLTGQSLPVTLEDQADAAVVAISQPVLERAAAAIGDGRTWDQLASDVSASPVPTSHLVTITATGVDAASAQRTSESVADAFAEIMREGLSTAAAGLTATPAGRDDPDIALRAQLLGGGLAPVEVFRTSQPEQLAPTSQTPIALGVVGLAIGALTILVLALTGPTISSARGAQRALALPAADFSRPTGGPDAMLLITRLLDQDPYRNLLICPINTAAEKSGLELVEWIQERDIPGVRSHQIQLVPEPMGAVLGARTRPAADRDALLLVVPQGTTRREVADAVALLVSWHAADAVLVTT